MTAADSAVDSVVDQLLAQYPPRTTGREDFLGARFDTGLAWVHFPVGLGGLGLPRTVQAEVEARLAAAGAPGQVPGRNGIGLSMAAPTILEFGTPEQHEWLRPLWTGEHVYCQLFSEPGAGSDLAALGTRAVPDGEGWRITGQKVWTSSAHTAQVGLLVARTDPGARKHHGMTYFLCDMAAPGIEIRPLRQVTGEAEFNEVFLTDVWLPDSRRLGPVGGGWSVVLTTLSNERVAINHGAEREAGMIGRLSQAWRTDPALRDPTRFDDVMRLWVAAEGARLVNLQLGQRADGGPIGPEGSVAKIAFAELAQAISGLEVELRGADGLRYDDWTMIRPELVDFVGRGPGYRYLRAKGNSIEGGTSEILRNIIAERVLGLPREAQPDRDRPWNEALR